MDPQGSYISKILHVKIKEPGPIGGARTRQAPPRSTNTLSGVFTVLEQEMQEFGGLSMLSDYFL